MKLTADLILKAPTYLNPLDQRELLLRGHLIPVIENLGSSRDLHDSIDLTDNDIRVLGNFPRLNRLKTLLVARNRISHIQPSLASVLPNLESLVLTANSLSQLSDLEPLAQFTRLNNLIVLENPVCSRDNYRLYLIWRIPSLKILDLDKIKDKERERAAVLFGSIDEPTELAQSIGGQVSLKVGSKSTGEKQYSRLLTDKEKEVLKQKLKTASSLAEMEVLERQLQSGYIE